MIKVRALKEGESLRGRRKMTFPRRTEKGLGGREDRTGSAQLTGA